MKKKCIKKFMDVYGVQEKKKKHQKHQKFKLIKLSIIFILLILYFIVIQKILKINPILNISKIFKGSNDNNGRVFICATYNNEEEMAYIHFMEII